MTRVFFAKFVCERIVSCREQVVEGTLRDGLDINGLEASDGCSHPAAGEEHESSQKEVAGFSSTTANKWLASPVELVLLIAHTLYNDLRSHDAKVQVANWLATYGAVSEQLTKGALKHNEVSFPVEKLLQR
ncbi:hypothetical protein MRX96_038877 [Rhipicephalus microplus]